MRAPAHPARAPAAHASEAAGWNILQRRAASGRAAKSPPISSTPCLRGESNTRESS